MSASENPGEPVRGESEGAQESPQSYAAKLRFPFLLILLSVMLAALWYDYLVARPNVEKAYNRITKLNETMNRSRTFETTKVAHVRQALGRQPSQIIENGIYTIEVYQWPAGMPLKISLLNPDEQALGLRTHDYYAVYRGNSLQRHYKFAIPPEEWERANNLRLRNVHIMMAETQGVANQPEPDLQMMQRMMEQANAIRRQQLRPPLESDVQRTSGGELLEETEIATPEANLEATAGQQLPAK